MLVISQKKEMLVAAMLAFKSSTPLQRKKKTIQFLHFLKRKNYSTLLIFLLLPSWKFNIIQYIQIQISFFFFYGKIQIS